MRFDALPPLRPGIAALAARGWALLFVASLCGVAQAQEAILTFPDEGDRLIWVASAPPTAEPADGVKTAQSTAGVSLNGKSDADSVYVWDQRTGNLAAKKVKDVKTAGWTLKPEAFTHIARVDVNVTSGTAPVAAATVDLNDGARTQTQLLDPASKGAATFYMVKPGALKLTVKYRSGTAMAKPVTQVFETPLKRSEAVPALTVSVPGPVETVGATTAAPAIAAPAEGEAPKAADPKAGAARESSGSPIGAAITYLVGLGIVGAIAWFALKYAKENPSQVSSKLEQLGVQIPKPEDEPLANPDPIPAPKAPEPPQKIMLDNAAPDPIATMAPSTVVTGQPRLVAESGDAIPVSDSELVVGRDAGLGLSLIGESTVSRRHAQLVKTGNDVVLTDLGSTNGTYVNGAKLSGQTVLRPGDQVQFGSVRFRFEG
jgi:hypothetical protein